MTIVADDLKTPNGIDISSDGKKIFYAGSVENRIWCYDIEPSGLRNKKLVIRLQGFSLDGIKVANDRRILAARFTKGTIAVVSVNVKVYKEYQLLGKDPTDS